MKTLASLLMKLDDPSPPSEKEQLIARELSAMSGRDLDLAIFLLMGGKLPRSLTASELKAEAAARSQVFPWLFEECLSFVGDVAETIGLLCHSGGETPDRGIAYWIDYLRELLELEGGDRLSRAADGWSELSRPESVLYNKLLIGTLRVSVPDGVLKRGIAVALGRPYTEIVRILGGGLDVDRRYFDASYDPDPKDSYPLPVFQTHLALECPVEELGDPEAWTAEALSDGMRIQIVKLNHAAHIWTESQEIVTDRFPELQELLAALPRGIILEGLLVAEKNGRFLPSDTLTARLTRRSVSKKLLAESTPQFIALDLLQLDGKDFQSLPRSERASALQALVKSHQFGLPDAIPLSTWSDASALHRRASKERLPGILIRELTALYQQGRTFFWAAEPHTVRAVLLYVKREGVSEQEYTFAVRSGAKLIPFAKTTAGMTDADKGMVETFIRKSTVERFGPVRMLEPKLIFEIAFETIQRSRRHKSGLIVRAPRIVRLCEERETVAIHTLEELRALIEVDELTNT